MEPNPNESRRLDEDLAERILLYLEAHPNACDTLDGITTWWLLRQRVIESRAAVRSALARLAAEGRVVERAAPDGTTLFAAARGGDRDHRGGSR